MRLGPKRALARVVPSQSSTSPSANAGQVLCCMHGLALLLKTGNRGVLFGLPGWPHCTSAALVQIQTRTGAGSLGTIWLAGLHICAPNSDSDKDKGKVEHHLVVRIAFAAWPGSPHGKSVLLKIGNGGSTLRTAWSAALHIRAPNSDSDKDKQC